MSKSHNIARRQLSPEPSSRALAGRRWISRGVLIAMLILLPPIGALLYVGPAHPAVVYRFIAEGGFLALWLGAACGIGLFALRALRLCEQGVPSALRCATAAAMGLGLLSLMVLALGLAGCLGAISGWLLIAGGWVLGATALWRWTTNGRARFAHWLAAPGGWEWLWLMATPFLMLILVGAMAPPGLLWTPNEPHGYDVVEYHLQVPREWFEAHRIVPLHHNIFSYVPFNVEMHYLLAMHLRGGPWAGMYLAQLMHAAFMILSVIAVYGLARRIARPAPAIIAALSILTVPWIIQLAPIAYDEGGFLLFGTLAIGWASRATFDAEHRLRRFALAGAMAGFAAGSKLTAVPEILAAIPVVASAGLLWAKLRSRAAARGWRPWAGVAVFIAMGLLTFAPWLVRNAAWTGNPLFPELMPMLGHDGLGDVQMRRWDKSLKPPPAQQPYSRRISRFAKEVIGGWQFGYLLLPLALIALGMSMRRPEAWFFAGLLLILFVFWIGFTHLQPRFLVLAVPVAALLAARIEWGRFAPLGVLLAAGFATVSWIGVNDGLSALLYGSESAHRPGIIQPAGSFQPLGARDLHWLTPEAVDPDTLPPDVTLVLVGDARAFDYQIPMSRLRYRTVFDVAARPGQDLVQAWSAFDDIHTQVTWLLIDPGELGRFEKTYFGLPPLAAQGREERAPYLVKRSH
ncbi:MAG TPA: glycosyltransferase family 39 protein [Tepidisphaeraceae bacterium]|nr:glycosyltransferase family 39 protein [Tepidisphaeraceae bacterium]